MKGFGTGQFQVDILLGVVLEKLLKFYEPRFSGWYTEELYKKDLHDTDSHDDVLTNLEPDILECEVKWALKKHHCEQS